MKAVRTKCAGDMPTPVYGKSGETGDYLADLKRSLKINIIKNTPDELVCDLIGIDAPIANALRRILIAEVPSMAIERVYMANNTSVIQDEVLSHRIGLIPLKVDPSQMEYLEPDEDPTDMNTLVFKLDVTAAENPEDPDGITTVYSRDLRWVPQGGQEERFADAPVRPVHDDIVICKLKPGQSVALEAHAVKGIGADHAKFSPVGTASYRLLPELLVADKVKGADAEALVSKCPMNVFDIEDLGGTVSAVSARPRDCTICRECIRGEMTDKTPFADVVTIHRVMDHFIFSIESTGALPASELFAEAVRILQTKSREVLAGLAEAVEA